MPKLLITGWCRGGLGYVAELCRLAGKEVSMAFGPDTNDDNLTEKLKDCAEIEISPYVGHVIARKELDCRKLFVMRDPMRVINSIYYHGLLHTEKKTDLYNYVFNYLPYCKEKFHGMPGQCTAAYLHEYLMMFRREHPIQSVVHLESGPKNLASKLLQVEGFDTYISPTVNSSGCKLSGVPSKLHDSVRPGIEKLLRMFGYKDWVWMPRGQHAHYVNPDWHC
jgi:hypothetical protein